MAFRSVHTQPDVDQTGCFWCNSGLPGAGTASWREKLAGLIQASAGASTMISLLTSGLRRVKSPVGQNMKRTYQASKVRRARTHGFLVRMKTRGGQAIINARRATGRKRLAV